MGQFNSHGDYSAANTGPGTQHNTYKLVGGRGPQAVATGLVAAGLATGISLLPQGSGAQRTWCVIVLSGCAVLCSLCLWSICGSGRKSLKKAGPPILGVVACVALSALWYQQLSAHGDVSVSVAVVGDESLADAAVVTATVDVTADRGYLRLSAELPDHYPAGMCAVDSTVSVAPFVNGVPQTGEAIRLENGQTGDIDLHGARGEIRIQAVVEAAQGCLLDLRFVNAVLYDKDGWLV